MLTECWSRRIPCFSTWPIDIIHSERVSSSTSSFFADRLSYALHTPMIRSKFWCHKKTRERFSIFRASAYKVSHFLISYDIEITCHNMVSWNINKNSEPESQDRNKEVGSGKAYGSRFFADFPAAVSSVLPGFDETGYLSWGCLFDDISWGWNDPADWNDGRATGYPIINLTSMPVHSLPQLSLGFPNIHQPTECSFNGVHNVIGFAIQVLEAMRRKRTFGEIIWKRIVGNENKVKINQKT